ncbi:hypothetical protein [Saccharothrix syringae]|uniref:Uncharacterized protein n=1 Tax=Saccharothrix syringae TaxID=103733 RepID=A0A5Q0HAM4_SACSY|nr:hypothetical protein [Saccharothrix syringae]QFZ23297.1 hypothetical protein EKG83_42905 [Saccharothrix syringae]
MATDQHDATALAAVPGDPAVGAFGTRVLLNRPAQEIREEVNDPFAEAGPDDVVLLRSPDPAFRAAGVQVLKARAAAGCEGSDLVSVRDTTTTKPPA